VPKIQSEGKTPGVGGGGTVPSSALLAAKPAGPPASLIHHWNHTCVAVGSEPGQVAESEMAPAGLVVAPMSTSSEGTMTPPLKGKPERGQADDEQGRRAGLGVRQRERGQRAAGERAAAGEHRGAARARQRLAQVHPRVAGQSGQGARDGEGEQRGGEDGTEGGAGGHGRSPDANRPTLRHVGPADHGSPGGRARGRRPASVFARRRRPPPHCVGISQLPRA
jgi:hypothetical protein